MYYSYLFLAAKLSSRPEWMKFSHVRLTYSGFPGHFVIELRLFGIILAGVWYSAYFVFLRKRRS